MPKGINKKCLACAQLSAQQAQTMHGQSGDGCWQDSVCHVRRSRYRNRQRNNERRRIEYHQKAVEPWGSEQPAESISLSVAEESAPYANLYIWREKRKDAPIHAIAASVFQDGSKVLEVAPIHCAGYRRRQLEQYVQKEVMGYLKARYGITFFADEIRLEPIECPIEGCPWGDHFTSPQKNRSAWAEMDSS